MPKEITHWTLAKTAFRQLGATSPLRSLLETHENLYLVGAVILDSPFYMQWGRGAAWIRNQSEKIHDTGQNPFAALVPVLENPSSDSRDGSVALLAGMTTHVFVDAAFHPLVIHFSGNPNAPDKKMRQRARVRHHLFETYLDLFFAGNSPFSIKTSTFSRFLKKIDIPRPAFMKMVSTLFSAATPQETALIQKAVQLHAALQSLFRRTLLKKGLHVLNRFPGVRLEAVISNFYPARIPGPETLFPRPISYRHPVTGDKRYVPVERLQEDALASIQKAFAVLDDALQRRAPDQGFAALKGTNLYTGMAGRRLADMRYFNDTIDLMSVILK